MSLGNVSLLTGLPTNAHITEVYGPSLFRKCLFGLCLTKAAAEAGFISSVATVMPSGHG